jgi:hypothetical protein
MLLLGAAIVVFALGIWIGLGTPGVKGREDRWVPTGARRLHRSFLPLDWWRPRRR